MYEKKKKSTRDKKYARKKWRGKKYGEKSTGKKKYAKKEVRGKKYAKKNYGEKSKGKKSGKPGCACVHLALRGDFRYPWYLYYYCSTKCGGKWRHWRKKAGKNDVTERKKAGKYDVTSGHVTDVTSCDVTYVTSGQGRFRSLHLAPPPQMRLCNLLYTTFLSRFIDSGMLRAKKLP